MNDDISRGVAQSGSSAAFGTQRPEVQILSPRPFFCPNQETSGAITAKNKQLLSQIMICSQLLLFLRYLFFGFKKQVIAFQLYITVHNLCLSSLVDQQPIHCTAAIPLKLSYKLALFSRQHSCFLTEI